MKTTTRLLLLASVLVVALPGAAGQGFTISQSPIEYETPVITTRTADGQVPETPFDVPTVHDSEVLNRTSIFVVTVNAQTDSGSVSAQIADFQLIIDGGNIPDCIWRFAGGTLTSETSSGVHLRCANGSGLEPGNHTVEVAATVVQNGNPVDQATVTMTLIQLEVITTATNFETATGLTAFEFLAIPLLALLGFWLITKTQDVAVRYVGVVLILMSFFAMIPLAGVTVYGSGLMTVLGIFAAYAAFHVGAKALERRKLTD